jgi:uncharacterized membrane protein (DUF485 family)
MLNPQREKQKSPQKRFLLVLGVVMVVFYLVLGLTIIFWNDIPIALNKDYRTLFGILLIIYSFFRFIRLMQSRRN